MILFKFLREDTGNCRVYYRGDKPSHIYCIQNDGSRGKDDFAFYTCSKDGEPSHKIRMPLDTSFDRKVMPASIEAPTCNPIVCPILDGKACAVHGDPPIDTSDIPEVGEEWFAKAKLVKPNG